MNNDAPNKKSSTMTNKLRNNQCCARLSVCGFTLIEILIALAIFAILAVVSAVGLHSLLKTHEHLERTNDRVREVMSAVTILRRDISQMLQRSVADTSGSRLPGLWVKDRTSFEFTRLGHDNPLHLVGQSALQRVGYTYDNHTLYRLTWPVVDRATKTTALRKILLSHIQHFKLNFVGNKGEWTEVWADNYHLPRAIILTLTLDSLGEMQLILPIVGRGYAFY